MVTSDRRPLVRPAFLGLAIASCLVLVPIVCLAAWDRVEARRLTMAVAAIRDAHEPITRRGTGRAAGGSTGVPADRYFRAAAAIAALAPLERRDAVLTASRAGAWPDDLVRRVRRHVDERRDALRLLDAAGVEFVGEFQREAASGTDAALLDLSRLAGFRTSLAVIDGHAPAAVQSLVAEARLWLFISRVVAPARLPILDVMERLGAVVNRTNPAVAGLEQLAAVLAQIDEDDRLKTGFMEVRAGFIDAAMSPRRVYSWRINGVPALGGLSVFEPIRRPFFERFAARRIEQLAAIVAALDQSWPGRAGAVAAAYAAQTDAGRDAGSTTGLQTADVALAKRIVSDLVLIRCARTTVAVETFRRRHGGAMPERLRDLVPTYLPALPIDPYSGGPLLVHREATSYAIYSVGSNGRDDGGDFGSSRFVDGAPDPRDLGLRIQSR